MNSYSRKYNALKEHATTLNETLIRIGITNDLEIRMYGLLQEERHVSDNIDIDSSITGMGPISAGVKFDLSNENGFIKVCSDKEGTSDLYDGAYSFTYTEYYNRDSFYINRFQANSNQCISCSMTDITVSNQLFYLGRRV